MFGLALGALALRPPPLVELDALRWLDTAGLVATWGLRLDALGLLVGGLAAGAIAVRARADTGRFLIPVAGLIGLGCAGDATLLLLFWLVTLFATFGAAGGDSRSGRRAAALALAYTGAFALVAATILGALGATTLLLPRTTGRIAADAILLCVLAVAAALPLLAVSDDDADGARPTLLALASALVVLRAAISWGSGAPGDLQIAAALLALLSGLLVGYFVGTIDSPTAAWRRLAAIEVALISAAVAIGGALGLAAATGLLLNLGLAALPIVGTPGTVGSSRRPRFGALVGLGAAAGLPPFPGFVGRALLLGLCLQEGLWAIAIGIAVLCAASFATLGALALAQSQDREDDSEEAEAGSAAGGTALALPIVASGLIPAIAAAVVGPVLELANLDLTGWPSIAQNVGTLPIAALAVTGLVGLIWSVEESRQQNRRSRQSRLRVASLARERTRTADSERAADRSHGREGAAAVLATVGRRLSEAGVLAILFQVALALLGLIFIAFRTGRV